MFIKKDNYGLFTVGWWYTRYLGPLSGSRFLVEINRIIVKGTYKSLFVFPEEEKVPQKSVASFAGLQMQSCAFLKCELVIRLNISILANINS